MELPLETQLKLDLIRREVEAMPPTTLWRYAIALTEQKYDTLALIATMLKKPAPTRREKTEELSRLPMEAEELRAAVVRMVEAIEQIRTDFVATLRPLSEPADGGVRE